MSYFGFIVGTGRCGTTMLAKILNAHKKICVPHELQIVFEYSGNGPRLYEIFSSGENLRWRAENFIKKIEELCPYEFNKFYDYNRFFYEQKYPIKKLSLLLNDLFRGITTSKCKEIFFEQTPWYGQRLDIIKELFPDTKVIHMIRDGRDVALSFSRTPWWHENPTKNLERWQSEVTKIVRDATTYLKKNQYLEVRYEDFVLDPEKALHLIVNFLGVKYEKTMLMPENLIEYAAYRKYDGSSISSNEYNNWREKKKLAVFSDNVYAWKKNNTGTFSEMPSHIRSALVKFGYEA